MLTQDELQSKLHYNPETGLFTWKINNKIAGCKRHDGYVVIVIKGKKYFSHRLAWLYTHGEFPKFCIDHINGDSSDNRLINLRDASISENQHNRKIGNNNTSGVKGVTWNKRHSKWHAQIRINYKQTFLGLFEDLELAKLVVQKARSKLHGNFANHG